MMTRSGRSDRTFLEAEGAVLGVADVGQVRQAWDGGQVAFEGGGAPLGPERAGETDDAVPARGAGDGGEFLVVEAEHDAFGGAFESDLAA